MTSGSTIEKEITFNISRYKPGVIDPPRFHTYRLPVTAKMTVLDCLEAIRLDREPTLVYRHSCHHSSCGTCACVVNGFERLACLTNVWDLDTETVILEPLKGFERIADLAVNMDVFFNHIGSDWSHLRPAELKDGKDAAPENPGFTRFENCIECGSCISACPVAGETDFMGPAALSALHREFQKSDRRKTLLAAGGINGARRCTRQMACSRVCPTKVYPSKHISDLLKELLNLPNH